MTLATTSTVTNPDRYRAIRAFAMDTKSMADVLEAVKAAGFEARRCKRGGLLIARKGLMLRLTDEEGALPLSLKGVVELINEYSEVASFE